MGQLRAQFFVAHLYDLLLAAVGPDDLGPAVEQPLRFGVELPRFDQRVELGKAPAQHGPGAKELLALARQARLLLDAVVIAAHRLGDLGLIALAPGRDDDMDRR